MNGEAKKGDVVAAEDLRLDPAISIGWQLVGGTSAADVVDGTGREAAAV